MTCTKCGGKIKVDVKDAHIEVTGDCISIEIVGQCEFCDHTVIVGCEGTLEIISNHYLER